MFSSSSFWRLDMVHVPGLLLQIYLQSNLERGYLTMDPPGRSWVLL